MGQEEFYPRRKTKMYQYIHGLPHKEISISESRLSHLVAMARKSYSYQFKIALRNQEKDIWTKWKPLNSADREKYISNYALEMAYEVHRSMLENEIIVESDFSTYKENLEVTKYLGKILEQKGFTPHYYFSGSKSIHIHLFLDYDKFVELSPELVEKINFRFNTKELFFQEFIQWIRKEIITVWGTKPNWFDKGLINSTHLIRSEMSLNKKGFKTFLGYKENKLPFEPPICNVQTREYPEIATYEEPFVPSEIKYPVIESNPHNLEELIEVFLIVYESKLSQKKNSRNFVRDPSKIRKEVEFMLSDKFKTLDDGYKRSMFIIINELKNKYSHEQIEEIMVDWNIRMGEPIKENEIKYRIKNKRYTISTKYIKEFLSNLGYNNI